MFKSLIVILFTLTSFTVFAGSLHKQPDPVGDKKIELSNINYVVLYMDALQKQNAKMSSPPKKLNKPYRRKTADLFEVPFMLQAHADDNKALIGCIDNGIIQFLETCDKSTWGQVDFDTESTQLMTAMKVTSHCEPEKHCGFTFGYSLVGDERVLFCANSSTKTCSERSEAAGGGRNLAKDLVDCEASTNSSSPFCKDLALVTKKQGDQVGAFCNTHPPGLSRACAAALASLKNVVKNTPSPVAPPAIDSRSGDVLYIGDSYSTGCFGDSLYSDIRGLADRLKGSPSKVRSVATCGSRPISWLAANNSTSCGFRSCTDAGVCQSSPTTGTSPSMAQLLNQNKPRTTIIELGINSRGANDMGAVNQLISQVRGQGSQCIWIGPPQVGSGFLNVEKYRAYVQLLKAEVTRDNRCTFIDSQDKTDRGLLSGPTAYHYGCEASKDWAKKAFAEMAPVLEQHFAPAQTVAPDAVQ